MIYELEDLNKYTLSMLGDRCRGCGWWQGYDGHWDTAQASAWGDAAKEAFDSWGKLALGDGRLLGMVQYGPAGLFPRARDFAGGPIDAATVLLTCGIVADDALASIKRSLVTAMIADFHERQIQTIEAFSLTGAAPNECRFFPHDFLRDCGFYPVRNVHGVQRLRLELGGSQPVAAPRRRRRLLERIKRAAPAPAPVAMIRSWGPELPDHPLGSSLPHRPATGCRSATACGGHG